MGENAVMGNEENLGENETRKKLGGKVKSWPNLLLLMVIDGAVTAEEYREDGHDHEAAVCDGHALGCSGYPPRGVCIFRDIFHALSYDIVHHICHLATDWTDVYKSFLPLSLSLYKLHASQRITVTHVFVCDRWWPSTADESRTKLSALFGFRLPISYKISYPNLQYCRSDVCFYLSLFVI